MGMYIYIHSKAFSIAPPIIVLLFLPALISSCNFDLRQFDLLCSVGGGVVCKKRPN